MYLKLGLAMAVLQWSMSLANPSISMDYCAKINTANMAANHSIFQSDGLCHDFCLNDGFALAVIHGDSCWCSDYVPDKSTQVSVDQCSDPCPGFPSDVCGGNGLFGYMGLNKSPSGTIAGGSSSPSTTAKSTTQKPSYSTVSVDGTVRTVTVTPTVVPTAPNGVNVNAEHKKGLSTGAAVGIAIAVIAVVAVAVAVIIGVFVKRRRRRQAEEQGVFDPTSQRGSSSGMMGTPKVAEVAENRYAGASDGRTVAESWDNSTQGRRRSTLMPIDPRMDPFTKGIYNRAENKSHDSVNSLRDDQDYSRRVIDPPRVLRATNPDPDDDD
ncbi:hypothetical protein VTK73DRAFT_1693 [Phialemonium thermophilum]|uniref:WSC domain-containing protein n=1 Tax=Phialemonium thermophilum TaxID=223376 RepID=A0ABR3X8P3_9PEZI